MYNKSEIMSEAWRLYKTLNYAYPTFSDALKAAWMDAKRKVEREKGTIAAEEIKVGDIVRTKNIAAEFSNDMIVTSISPNEICGHKYLIIKGFCGKTEMEICPDFGARINKVGEVVVPAARIAA